LANTTLKVVFDTNIYIAAFLRPGMSEELLNRALRGDFRLYTSPFILEELTCKLRDKAKAKPKEIKTFFEIVKPTVLIVNPKAISPVVRDDPDDDHIIACAQAAEAHLLITLDRHLLRLKQWKGISILHPKTFSWVVE